MSRVRGDGIKKGTNYTARPAMAEGLFWLHAEPKNEGSEADKQTGFKVEIPTDLVRKIGPKKRAGETLQQSVCRLLETGLKFHK